MGNWFRVTIVVPVLQVEDVSAQLFDFGCAGVHEDEVDQGVCLIAYFEGIDTQTAIQQACENLLAELDIASEVHLEPVPDEDWSTSWREYFKPVYATPRIVVCPAWAPEPVPEDGFIISIDPKMAFGTGHHETTRLALMGLESCVSAGASVFDVGTGSGILSIAAMKLGAASVMAVDTDPPAIENTQENLALNDILEGVVVKEGSVGDVEGVFDVIVANIISSILVPLIPAIASRTSKGGHVVLGGILTRESAAFQQAVLDAGFVIDQLLEEGEWVCAVGKKQ
ncbi:MAG: 50S ribosomal protein L11 methyltransferase [Candidatus Latescibacteria bacterium]|nr:50S ribosomal protein L11 methyltransferase [Candidatus Latescibacterota bacterium]